MSPRMFDMQLEAAMFRLRYEFCVVDAIKVLLPLAFYTFLK